MYYYTYEFSVFILSLLSIKLICEKYKVLPKLVQYLSLTLKTIVGGIIMAFLIPVGVPILFLFLLYSRIVKFIIIIWYGKNITEPLHLDGVWGTAEADVTPYITCMYRLNGSADVKKMRKMFQEKVLDDKTKSGDFRFRKFKQVFVKHLDYYVWENVDDFDIKNHIRLVKMKEGMNDSLVQEDKAEERVCRFISSAKYSSLSPKHPPWEIVLIDDGRKDSYACVLRFDHAIADGISLVRMLLEKMIDNPQMMGEYRKPVSIYKRLFMYLWSVPLFPFSLKLMLFSHGDNVLHGPKLTGKKVFVSSKPIPMSVLRQLKSKAGVSISDVLYSCLSAALAKHFQKRNCPVPQIVIFFPMGYQDPKADLVLSNIFGLALTEFPILGDFMYHENKAIARLMEIKRTFNKIKADPAVLAIYHASLILTYILPDTLARFCFKPRGVTMGTSNMPGPKKTLTIIGNDFQSMRFWVPERFPTATGFTMISYLDQVHVSFSADRAVVANWKEGQVIIKDFLQEVENLKRELLVN